jgi:hypothetical protein
MPIVNSNTSSNTLSNPTLDKVLDTNLTNAQGVAAISSNIDGNYKKTNQGMYGQVAGFNKNQENAQTGITGMAGQTGFGTAQDALGALGSGGIQSNYAGGIGSLGAAAGNIQGMSGNSWLNPGTAQSFMNPYQQGVTDIANQEAARTSGIQQNQNNAQAAQAGAFGGSRAGVVQGENQRTLAMLQNQNQINGANQAYNSGMQQYNTQQTQQLNQNNALTQAGTAQGNLANSLTGQEQNNAMNQSGVATAAQNANLGLEQAKLGVGNQQQALTQNEYNTEQQNATMQFNQPMQSASWLQSIIQGSPQAMTTSSATYAPPPNLGAQLTGLGIAGLGAYGASSANNNSAYGNRG